MALDDDDDDDDGDDGDDGDDDDDDDDDDVVVVVVVVVDDWINHHTDTDESIHWFTNALTDSTPSNRNHQPFFNQKQFLDC